MTRFSVIICTRDRADALRRTLDSLSNMSVPAGANVEVVVVDNGSADTTPNVVEGYSAQSMDARYFSEKRPGKGYAYNKGLSVATGDILLFCDDDVILPRDWLIRLSKPIVAGDADAVAGGVRLAPHLERPWMTDMHRLCIGAATADLSDDNFELIGANMAFRRDVLIKVPRFDTELGPGTETGLWSGEETLFSWQLLRAGYRIKLLKEVEVEHHFDPSRLMREAFLRRAESMGRSRAYLDYHWSQNVIRHPFLRYLKASLRLFAYRMLKRWDRSKEGIALTEFDYLTGFYFYKQYLKERRKPFKYQKYGLVKLGNPDRRHASIRSHRIAIVCTGMDRVARGYEVYARDLFALLKSERAVDVTLIKGNGARERDEKVVLNLHRDSIVNRALCFLVGRQRKYYIEYVTFAAGLLPLLALKTFDVFYVLEGPIYKFLSKWRSLTHGKFKLIHFTGGQLGNIPATPRDYLHHVTPAYREQADRCGFRPENQFLIPHFIDIDKFAPANGRKAALRKWFNIPENMPVVLSVGTIDSGVKRMDYVIREAAALPQAAFLVLVGHEDESSEPIRKLARELLPDRHVIGSVPRPELADYYNGADIFVLASLREGFGLAFLEALASGLPVIAHDYDVSRFVLGEHGFYSDLTKQGNLTAALERALSRPKDEPDRQARTLYVREKFGREKLKKEYYDMFRAVWRNDAGVPAR